MSTKERLDILKERLDDLFTENQRLKELCDRYEEEHKTTFEEWKKTINIINKIRKWLEEDYKRTIDNEVCDYPRYYLDKFDEIVGSDKE